MISKQNNIQLLVSIYPLINLVDVGIKRQLPIRKKHSFHTKTNTTELPHHLLAHASFLQEGLLLAEGRDVLIYYLIKSTMIGVKQY